MRRLLAPALLIYSVILFRAGYQAVTLDEADAFNAFATGDPQFSFYPTSNNHVLNSLLARYTTQAFGVSQFTFRMPSLFGAALYLLATAFLATRLAPNRQLLGFAFLTCNPFFLDYLIASRGYGLALGFLASAIALGIKLLEGARPWIAALLSVCCALAVAANLSFAFCMMSTLAALLVTLLLKRTPMRRWTLAALAATLPGAAAGYAIVGQTIRDFPRNQLYYGALTWQEMWLEMLEAVYPRQNLSITAINLEPALTAAHHAAAYLILIPIAVAVWAALTTESWPIRFVWLALAATLTAHGLAHAIQNLPLPLDRTSIFIALLLGLGIIHGAASAPNAVARNASTAVLCGSLIVFALAFRTNYFRIWDFDLDTNRWFAAFVQYAKEHPVQSAGCTWRYGGAYNFYRRAWKADVPKCEFIEQDNPKPLGAYFMHVPGQAEFIAKAKPQVIYQGPVSSLTIGISPDAGVH